MWRMLVRGIAVVKREAAPIKANSLAAAGQTERNPVRVIGAAL
jgi:hypothetical protein